MEPSSGAKNKLKINNKEISYEGKSIWIRRCSYYWGTSYSCDGVVLTNGQIELVEMNKFVLVKYEIPSHATKGKDKVTVEFRSHFGQIVPKGLWCSCSKRIDSRMRKLGTTKELYLTFFISKLF
jgi:hypothetical protein